ncbi:hypothetical protein ACSBR2_006128 [Camellia fascicularis]
MERGRAKKLQLMGRVQFDLLQVMQRDYKSYSLNSVLAHFLNEQARNRFLFFVQLDLQPLLLSVPSNRYFPSRSLLLVECMPVKNATNFCFCYPRRMMRKTFNFDLCYFEL